VLHWLHVVADVQCACSLESQFAMQVSAACVSHKIKTALHEHGWHVEPKYPVLHTRQLLGVAQLLIVLLSQWSMQMYGSQVAL
jgi:hypothetical protein